MIAMEKKFLAFNQPDLGEAEIKAVTNVIHSGWIGTGKISHQFEQEFAEFMGGGYAVAVSSCSMGLLLALQVCVGEGETVITTPLTFAATINAIINVGLKPILVDVDFNGCLDPTKMVVDDKVGAILPVHYSGTHCQTNEIKKRAGKIPIVEDCAHAFGGKLKRFGNFQVFSFYANKNITCGEGGMVLTRDKVAADRIRVFASQGLSHGAWKRYGGGPLKHYEVEEIGYKGNLPDVLAAIGLTQLRRWPALSARRNRVLKVYENALGPLPDGHSGHFYPYRTKNRDEVRKRLWEKGIGTGIHYKPIHLEPAYEYLGYEKGQFPNAERWGEEELSLPVSATMTPDDAYRVVEEVLAS